MVSKDRLVLSKMRSKDMTGPLCPICGSPLFPRLGFRAGMLYECKKCGYVGPLFVRNPLKSKKMTKNDK
jgi:hypothetical protein